MSKIFISYRRDDNGGWAGRLWDKLEPRFGRENLFMDIDTLEPGVDFVEVIERTVKACDVLLAVIGKRWVSISDNRGRRRLDDPRDFVRLEVAAALQRKILVIPVLVGGAGMPRADELPKNLKPLSRRQAFEIRDTSFRRDVELLIPFVERGLGLPSKEIRAIEITGPARRRDVRSEATTELRDRTPEADGRLVLPPGVPAEPVTRSDRNADSGVYQPTAKQRSIAPAAPSSPLSSIKLFSSPPQMPSGRGLRAIRPLSRQDAIPKSSLARILPAQAASARDVQLQSGIFGVNEIDGLEYVWIPPGEFQMGAVPGDSEIYNNENPRHPVKISKWFWLSRTPVTVEAYRKFAEARRRPMPSAPSFNREWAKLDQPIVNVSWDDAIAYCEWARTRLPTEAEWEYAARVGREGMKFPWGDVVTPENANYRESKVGGTTPVTQHEPNGFGLYDVCGNVWEWTADWWDEEYYAKSPPTDPAGAANGEFRVVRGGSWVDNARYLRLSCRYIVEPGDGYDYIGFRCAGDRVP